MQDEPVSGNQILDAWEAAVNAENFVKAYDLASYGIKEFDHPAFYCAKFISLLSLNKAFNPWRSVVMPVLGRPFEEYSKSDLKELLSCALAFVEREQSGRSYECLGRARALQTLELSESQREEKIAICKQAISDLERSHQFYLEEQERATSRELKERLATDIHVVSSMAEHLKEELQKPQKGKSGCFIATAALGDANAPEVVFLKQYRDQKLLSSVLGKTFVRYYYFLSPPLAKIIVRFDFLRRFIRFSLIRPTIWLIQTFDANNPRRI